MRPYCVVRKHQPKVYAFRLYKHKFLLGWGKYTNVVNYAYRKAHALIKDYWGQKYTCNHSTF